MNKIRKKLSFIVIILLILSSIYSIGIVSSSSYDENVSLSEISLSYSFNEPIFETFTISDETYTRIIMDNNEGSGDPGEPVLPVEGCNILIPYGYEFESVAVTVQDARDISLSHLIEPGQNFYPYNYEGEIEVVNPDVDIYNSPSLYPGKNYDIVSIQKVRGYNVLVLRLYPIQYSPASNKISIASSMHVTINSNEVISDKISDIHENFRGLQKDIDKVRDMVDNPIILNSYPGPFPTHTYEYVIITTESLKNYQGEYNFQALCNKRIQYGLNARIETLENIIQTYSGSDTQEKIRNFIKYAYNNWDTEYVLLGGDDDVIPSRKIEQSYWWYQVDIPTDLYYACLDGDGPTKNGGDIIAEVYVGRACVGNTDEVSNFVKKTIEYIDGSSTGDYLEKALWVGEHLGFGGVSEFAKDMKEQNIGYCNADGYVTNGLPEGPSNYIVDRLYEKDGSWSKSDLKNKINNGVHLMNHLGHGNVNYAMKLYNYDVDDLTNDKYFFVYSQTCLAGHFDDADCFAEEITVKSPHAAFAAVMNARYGWGQGQSTDGPSQRYDREFWDALYGEHKSRLGQANHDSKEDNAYRINEPLMRWCYYETNLFGDPALVVQGAGPILSISSPSSHDFGKMLEGQTKSATFQVWNSGPDTLYYSVSTDVSWLRVSPVSGSSSGEHDTITITINTNGMSNGKHEADIVITSNGGVKVFHVIVKVGPVLSFFPDCYNFGQMEEGETDSTTFEIWNSGLLTLDYSFSTEVSWLSVSPVSGSSTGEHDVITVSIDTKGVANGSYNVKVFINTNAEDDVLYIRVKIGSVLEFSPKFYDFGNVGLLGDGGIGPSTTASTTLSIWNNGTGRLIYSIHESYDWVSVYPDHGTNDGPHDTFDTITVTISVQDLNFIGHHSADIVIDSNGGTGVFTICANFTAIFYSTSNDGTIHSKAICGDPWESGYYMARDAPTGTVDDTSNLLTIGQKVWYSGTTGHEWTWEMYRSFLFFDTSSLSTLSSDYEIVDAWISLYPVNGEARYVFDIIARTGQPTYPHNPLQEGDFDITHYYAEVGRFHPRGDNVNFNVYTNLSLNELGLQYINENGITKFCLMTSMDWNNEALYSRNWISGCSSEGAYKPILNLKIDWTNKPPSQPSNPDPKNGERDVILTPTLSCIVKDPDEDPMDVSFYLDKKLIGIDYGVESGGVASFKILDDNNRLEYGATYDWYAVANDGEYSTKSDIWTFSTLDELMNNAPHKPFNPHPFDGETDVSRNPTLLVEVFDPDDDPMDVSFYLDDELIGTDHGIPTGGTASIDIGFDLDYDTTYSWYAVANDGEFENISETWEFTTLQGLIDNHAPHKPVNPMPYDGAMNIDISPTLKVDVFDIDGDILDVSFYINGDLAGNDNDVASGNTASIDLSFDLIYGTSYSWYAVADDGEYFNTSDVWTFTTLEEPGVNHAPFKPYNPDPSDGETDVSLNPTLYVDVYDPDGDSLDVSFYLDGQLLGVDQDVLSGSTSSFDMSTMNQNSILEFGTTYNWYAIADDGEFTNTSATWEFTTEENISIKITKPMSNKIYFRNRDLFQFFFTIIIGEIDVEVNLTDSSGDVDEIKFYVDDELKQNNSIDELIWNWDERVFGFRTIKVAAFSDETEVASDELDVLIFNFNLFQFLNQ